MHVAIPLLLVLAGAPGAAPPAPAVESDDTPLPADLEPRDEEVPPGSAADQALCRELRGAIALGIGSLARISMASYRMEQGRSYAELEARAKAGDTEAAALRADLEAAGSRAAEVTPRKALVHPCRGTLLELEHRMPYLEDPRAARDMPKIRADARACVERIGRSVAAVVPAAEALETELHRVDRYLERARTTQPDAAKAGAAAEAARR